LLVPPEPKHLKYLFNDFSLLLSTNKEGDLGRRIDDWHGKWQMLIANFFQRRQYRYCWFV